MKKLFATFLLVLTVVSLLSVTALAQTVLFEDDYVSEDEIVLASFNGVYNFTANSAKIDILEDACYWLGEYAKSYNIKYASFTGRISSSPNYTHTNVVAAGKGTVNEMYKLIDNDEEWKSDFLSLKRVASVLTYSKIPYGVSIHMNDYYSNGFDRRNHILNNFTSDDYVGGINNVIIEAYDANSFAVIVENGDEKYIIYQLEAYPRRAILDWFKKTNAAHPEKRAFVFTTSFLDKEGEMFTQYDPTKYTWSNKPYTGNTTMTTNMVYTGNPFDGEQIWNFALSKYDNVAFIMSSNASVGKDIKIKKLTNENGYTCIAAVANLVGGWGTQGCAYPVLIKFNEAKATLDLRYAVPYYNNKGGYVEESKVLVEFENLAPLPDPDPVTLFDKVPSQANGANTAFINGYEGNVFKPDANMTKAEASTIFARLLLNGEEIPTSNTTRFTDVPTTHWAYDAIAYLDTLGYYYTNTSDKYYPDANITRAEFVELAYFASEVSAAKGTKFKDVPADHKYYAAVTGATALGLINGYADGTFKPEATITRAEVVTIINRLLSLIANEETVDKTHLTTVFSDISGHWAEYQILMASNSNVHNESFYEIDSTIYTETSTSISFENKHIRVVLNKRNGKVDKVIYLPTGEDILAPNATPWFSYAKSARGATLEPVKLELVDGRLKFTYKGGYIAYFIVEVFDNYYTIQLDSNIPNSLMGVNFGYVAFNYTASENPGTYRCSGVIMDTRVNQRAVPGGYTSTYGGSTRTDLGVPTMGAKMGFAFSRMEDHREVLKEIVLAIDPEKGLTSTHGGPFTYDPENKDLFEDYVMVSSNLNINTAVETAKLANKYSFNQIDIHQGNSTFTQGDFDFRCARTPEDTENKTFVTATTFKERIADKMHEAGVQIGLHTYSSLVASVSTKILTNPKWQQQLHYTKTYTLRGDLSKYKISIKTVESAADFVGYGLPYSGNTKTSYILIDEEIIKVSAGTTSGFINVSRGQFGTKVVAHKDGAEIRHLLGYYGMFQPKPGSELFWYLADETARVYNEGDFDMIYLDGFESFSRFVTSETTYYYYAEFCRRVISQCIKKPIYEDSCSAGILWAARGRGGAIDYPTKGYKLQINGHASSDNDYKKRYYTATLGWFNFDPDESAKAYRNTIYKTIFHDDLDFMGSLAIAYDFSNVAQGFSINLETKGTRHADNLMYYSVYSKLRKGGYFSDEVKAQLKAGKSKNEYRLFQQEDGSYAFKEMKYVYNRIFDMKDKSFVTGTATNPYGAQTPFIRIEQRGSTLGENEILVYAIDENKEVSSVKGNNKSITSVDLSDRYAMKIRVYGNGDATGGVMISVTSPTSGEKGRTDYYIPTSHTGWREFILMDADNGEHPGSNFSNLTYTWNNYETYRANPTRAQINAISINTSGNVAGVKLDDLRACKAVDAPAKNPSITIGGSTITFECEIHSTEFIEFYPDTGKAYLNYYEDFYKDTGAFDHYEAHTKEISYTGTVTVPTGEFTYTYDAEPMTEAPLRASVKLGFQGAVIANPDTWVAPEIDMGEASLEIKLR